jgi:uncharacterized protein (DUF362 family)
VTARSARAFLGRLDDDCSNYLALIAEGLNFIGFGAGLPARPKVFVKPNLTFPTYQPGVMTSPAALEATLIALKAYTPDLWLGDSDSGGYNPFSMDEVYATTGIAEFAERHGVEVVNLSRVARVPFTFRAGGRNITIQMPRLLVDEIDLLVTMPVPKIHMNTKVSLTFKNQWGCIPEPNDRLRLHPHFAETIVAINKAVRAGCAIIDGTYGLNRSGPLRGDPVRLGWVCVTNDIGAGARLGCELMGVPLEKVGHLRYAESQGLIPTLDEIELNTELEPFRGPVFYLRRDWTDLPGLMAFQNSALAHIAYFSRWSALLHRLLYKFREPFYAYRPK